MSNQKRKSESLKDMTNFDLKLGMRRAYINKYFPDQPLSVLETHAGPYSYFWEELKKEFTVERYVGIDKSPEDGNILQGDPEEMISGVDLSQYNVFDVDPVKLPWRIFANITKAFKSKAVLFLTVGMHSFVRPMDGIEKIAMGIPVDWEQVPINIELFKHSIPYCLKYAQGNCLTSDFTYQMNESVDGRDVIGYIAAFLDGTEKVIPKKAMKKKDNTNQERADDNI